MSVLRWIKIFNSVVNSLGSLVLWYYILYALWIGVKYLEINITP